MAEKETDRRRGQAEAGAKEPDGGPGETGPGAEALGVSTDAEALRLAIDHLLSHFQGGGHGEEE